MGQDEIQEQFEKLLRLLNDSKPEERSELARRYAISITDTEKIYAYYNDFILGERGIR